MAKQNVETEPQKENQQSVKDYFSLIRELRSGNEEAVGRLVDMWDADGVFEFAGAPPLTATFQGRNAIHVLYRNRFCANGMPLRLELKGKKADADLALGVVDTEVRRTRSMQGNKVVAGWTTVIGTNQGQGFEVSGAHTFTFRDGKIRTLKVVISPQPEPATRVAKLSVDELAVDDIGELSLAAWAVV